VQRLQCNVAVQRIPCHNATSTVQRHSAKSQCNVYHVTVKRLQCNVYSAKSQCHVFHVTVQSKRLADLSQHDPWEVCRSTTMSSSCVPITSVESSLKQSPTTFIGFPQVLDSKHKQEVSALERSCGGHIISAPDRRVF